MPLKHYDPDQEDELLKKYCPEKSKEKKKGGEGREGKRVKVCSLIQLLVNNHNHRNNQRAQQRREAPRFQQEVQTPLQERAQAEKAHEEVG